MVTHVKDMTVQTFKAANPQSFFSSIYWDCVSLEVIIELIDAHCKYDTECSYNAVLEMILC